jgi:hypothetical protein
MMIARNWTTFSVTVEGRRHRSPFFSLPKFNAYMIAGEIRCGLPNRRDREVPYGMKGGELDGRKKESC